MSVKYMGIFYYLFIIKDSAGLGLHNWEFHVNSYLFLFLIILNYFIHLLILFHN